MLFDVGPVLQLLGMHAHCVCNELSGMHERVFPKLCSPCTPTIWSQMPSLRSLLSQSLSPCQHGHHDELAVLPTSALVAATSQIPHRTVIPDTCIFDDAMTPGWRKSLLPSRRGAHTAWHTLAIPVGTVSAALACPLCTLRCHESKAQG